MKKIPILSASYFLLALALCMMVISGCSCSAPKPTSDPLAGWTYKPFPGSELPPYGHNTNHLDNAIIDDYQNFIKTKGLIGVSGPAGFYEDGIGQLAVEFEAFTPNVYESWHYVLIYNKENKRIKVVQYGRTRYQS
jgi:hypothetical protein